MSSGSRTTDDLGHGPRLTRQEYERRIVELYRGLPPSPSRRLQDDTQRRELDLTIDYRLGRNFPQHRRENLWHIQQRIEKRRMSLLYHWLLRFLSPKRLNRGAERIAQFVVDEYAKELTPQELEAYFGQEEVQHPALPLQQ